MPEFQYTARQLSGSVITGTLEAASEHEVLATLSERALFPVTVAVAVKEQARQKVKGRKVPSRHLATFYSQLADLLHSGVPLLRSLEILERQKLSPALSAVLQDVRGQVADGSRLAESMAKHPRAFGNLAVSMIAAGEEGGFLEDVLKRIAAFTEHQEELRGRVLGAMLYPLFLLVIGTIIVTCMLVWFVPKFTPIFERQAEKGELPWPTIALLAASDSLQHYGLWILLAAAGAGWWLYTWINSDSGGMAFDRFKLRAYLLGPVVRSLATSRFCRILGTLLKNGVPLLPALKTSKDATGNRVLAAAVAKAAENVTAGKSLAKPLAASGEFSQDLVEMIGVGEEANNLEQVLIDIANNLERRTQRNLDLFVRMLEPLMLLLMAGAILFVVVALLLPVFQGAGALD